MRPIMYSQITLDLGAVAANGARQRRSLVVFGRCVSIQRATFMEAFAAGIAFVRLFLRVMKLVILQILLRPRRVLT